LENKKNLLPGEETKAWVTGAAGLDISGWCIFAMAQQTFLHDRHF
jgi:hypothetical protein